MYMKQWKKKITCLVMTMLLACTILTVKTTPVMAASVGQVKSLRVVYTKGVTKISWKKVSGATSYQVYRAVPGKSYAKIKTTKSISCTDTKKGEFYYKVRAVRGSSKGAFSSAVPICTVSGWIGARVAGTTFVNAGTSSFGIKITNPTSKNLYFLGQTGNKGTVYPVMIYDKINKKFITMPLANQAYLPGVLSEGGATNVKTRIVKKGNWLIEVSAVGMIDAYYRVYDDASRYAYYITGYFRTGSLNGKNTYAIIVSSYPTSAKEYLVERVK